jgi:hypothetical protein
MGKLCQEDLFHQFCMIALHCHFIILYWIINSYYPCFDTDTQVKLLVIVLS